MRRVSSAEFVRSFSAISDAALNEPVILTRNGRDRLVLLGVETYQRLLALALADPAERPDLEEMVAAFRQELKEIEEAGASARSRQAR